MFVINATPSEMKAASVVADSVQLKEIRLTKMDASRGIISRGSDLPLNVDFKLDNYSVLKENQLLVEVVFHLSSIKQKNINDPMDYLFNIDMKLAAIYQMPLGPIPELVLKEGLPSFAKYNGLFNCWPYFRSELQHILSSMGLPHFSLPPLIIRVGKTESDVERPVKQKKTHTLPRKRD